jgi:hypothetical protein
VREALKKALAAQLDEPGLSKSRYPPKSAACILSSAAIDCCRSIADDRVARHVFRYGEPTRGLPEYPGTGRIPRETVHTANNDGVWVGVADPFILGAGRPHSSALMRRKPLHARFQLRE